MTNTSANKIVYALMSHVDYEGDNVVGLYSTKAKAEKALSEETHKYIDGYSIDKYRVNEGWLEEVLAYE